MKKLILLLCSGLIVNQLMLLNAVAQDKGIYHKEVNSSAGMVPFPCPAPGSFINLNVDPLNTFNSFYAKKGYAKVWTDFGSFYKYGGLGSGANMDFNIEVTFTLELLNASSVISGGSFVRTLKIDNSKPEAVFSLNLEPFISTSNTGFLFDEIKVNDFCLTDMSGSSYGDALNNLIIHLYYELEYGIDADFGSVSVPILDVPADITPKVRQFNWTTTGGLLYPDYQFQLVKLFNKSENSILNEAIVDIQAPGQVGYAIDWSEALTIETESADKNLYLTMSEGTGVYAWRVRPVGTFYEGGVANTKNWGDWFDVVLPGHVLDVSLGNTLADNAIFFYEDIDDNKNTIYSRVFSEQNKIAENITYANSLQQVKQTQSYLPPEDPDLNSGIKLIGQTVMDKSGRPALKSMPVPIEKRLDGYRDQFMKSLLGDLYTAENYDKDINYRSPDLVEDGQGFVYYSDNNPDKTIPDAEKYPFSRTIYENDGSSRTKEQSGVGKRQMIGEQQAPEERGRTVRTFYGTPSQDELDKVFADEAPRSENVFKTVTVDQNNTASVTYTNKEGKVIATCLTFDETDVDNTEQLDPLPGQPAPATLTQVNDHVTKNVKADIGFVSTKKLSVLNLNSLNKNPVTFSYTITPEQLDGLCTDITIDCGFEVKVIIHNLDNNSSQTLGPVSLSLGNTVNFGTVDLDAGNYIIEKVVSQETTPVVQITQSQEKLEKQLRPIAGWITSTLEKVNCEMELMMFYNDLDYFVKSFQSGSGHYIGLGTAAVNIEFMSIHNCNNCSETTYTLPAEFMQIYSQDHSHFNVQLDNTCLNVILPYTAESDCRPYAVGIHTPCCDINVSVLYTPPFKCPTVNQLVAHKDEILAGKDFYALEINDDLLDDPHPFDLNFPDYLPDFEGYAVSMIKQCFGGDETLAKDHLYSHMSGWHHRGMLNQMVYHMLTDKYSCRGMGVDPCISPGPDCSDPFVQPDPWVAPAGGYENDGNCAEGEDPQLTCTQYRCTDLAKCWRGIILNLMASVCPIPDLDAGPYGDGGKISKGFDDQNQNPEGDKHDDHVDDNFDLDIPWPFGWFMETLMSWRLRDKQDLTGAGSLPQVPTPPLQVNLVEQFLNCTGYAFADMIDPTPPSPANYPVCSPEFQDNVSIFDPDLGLPTEDYCFIPLDGDFDADVSNGEYNPDDYFNIVNTILPDGVSTGGPLMNTTLEWSLIDGVFNVTSVELFTLGKMFKNIKNPMYAFKYFEYDPFTFKDLEVVNCYRDPSICYDHTTGNEVCCCDVLHTPPLQTCDPCYFCSVGYIICPQTKKNWSCGQRYTWYTTIKNYYPTQQADPANIPPNMDCTELADPSTEWVQNPYGGQPHPNPLNLNGGHEVITQAQYTASNYSGVPVPADMQHIDGSISSTISFVEKEAVSMTNQCLEKCGSDEMKSEFRRKILEMFNERCYVIGGCKMPGDNIVPLEDVDVLVVKLVEQCSTQCNITTYNCVEDYCRMLDEDPEEYQDIPLHQGMTNQTTIVKYGVGGTLNSQNPHPAQEPNYFATPGTLTHYPLLPGLPFTFAEYTLWLQATQWDFDLDIVSKCNQIYPSGSTAVTVDVDGVPTDAWPGAIYNPSNTTPVYIKHKASGLFIEQDSPFVLCEEQTNPPNEWNPNTANDHDDYAVNPNLIPPDPDAMVGDPVRSPKIGLHVVTPP